MILLYSGANSSDTDQMNPSQSLGGFVSSTTISNGLINNIFSTVSKSVVVGNKRETYLVVLKNTTGATVYNVQVWIDNTVENNHSSLKLAAVSAALDGCSNPYFEQISSSDAIPYQCVLESANGQGNAIDVGQIANGDCVGIWMSRTITLEDFPTANGATKGTSQAAIDALTASIANPITIDNSNLVINFDTTTTTTTTVAPTTTTTTLP